MTRGRLGGLVAVTIGPLGLCVMLGWLLGGDPMLAIEVGGVALAVTWGGLVVREINSSNRLARALSSDAVETRIFGVPCRVTAALGADALVIGSIRPRIFVGASLASSLTPDELQAVIYHEDHHRRTRAPLRAAALDAWLRLLGRSQGIRGLVLDRLADLETLADADAMRRGATPSSLARALMKGEPSPQPVAFSYASERRVEHLLNRAAGSSTIASGRLPYEWLPAAIVAVTTLACHAGL